MAKKVQEEEVLYNEKGDELSIVIHLRRKAKYCQGV